MSKRYTAEELIAVSCSAWHDRIRREVPPEGITAREIIERVDTWEARWPLIRLLARADRKQLVLWCCDVAQDVRHLVVDEEARDAADLAIRTAVAWTEGAATQDDCYAAADAANAAANAYAVAPANATANAIANAIAAAAYAAYAADAAIAAPAYAANAADAAAVAAADAAVATRKDALHGYLHWLVDRMEGIDPEHPDAAEARAECERAADLYEAARR